MVAVMISRPSTPRTTGPGPSALWTIVPRVRSAVRSGGQVGKVHGTCPHSVDLQVALQSATCPTLNSAAADLLPQEEALMALAREASDRPRPERSVAQPVP